MAWLAQNWALIATILLSVSETLALVPALKSNGIIDGIVKTLKSLGVKDQDGL